jgi:hypothetical protein
MDDVGTVMAKLAGIRKAVAAALDEKLMTRGREVVPRRHFDPDAVKHQFTQAANLIEKLRELLPDLYGDFHQIAVEPTAEVVMLDKGERSGFSTVESR